MRTVCEETTQSKGKNHLQGLEGGRCGTQTGLRRAPIATSQIRKLQDLWDTESNIVTPQYPQRINSRTPTDINCYGLDMKCNLFPNSWAEGLVTNAMFRVGLLGSDWIMRTLT
jgi:hypothetical protein